MQKRRRRNIEGEIYIHIYIYNCDEYRSRATLCTSEKARALILIKVINFQSEIKPAINELILVNIVFSLNRRRTAMKNAMHGEWVSAKLLSQIWYFMWWFSFVSFDRVPAEEKLILAPQYRPELNQVLLHQ